jgi:cysteinyl-tRNA synthetase
LIMMSELNMIFCSWNFQKIRREKIDIPDEITELATQRINAKKAKNFKLADELRNKIVALGYNIIDTKDGYEIGTAAGCLSGKVLCDLAEE